MNDSFPDIKSVVVRVVTDKPVRKTPYQVKGVFMRQFPDQSIIPMLNGSFRDKFLYPRVQVKILNEQIYIIGIKEGVDPVIELSHKFNNFDFGNITFEVKSFDIEESVEQFIPSEKLLKYRFITPWIALNHMTGGKYKFLTDQEKLSFLNKLIGQNIIFLANELGTKLEDNIYTRVSLESFSPNTIDDNKWGAFMGDFETNFFLPSYIGVGNGITRGFGTIFGALNKNIFDFGEDELKNISKTQEPLEIDSQNDLEVISALDVPKPKRKRRKKRKLKRKNQGDNNKQKIINKDKSLKKSKNKRFKKPKKNFNHEPVNINFKPDIIEEPDEHNFNTEKHHKKQHKF